MKKTETMIFYLPIAKEELIKANRQISEIAKSKQKVEIKWKMDTPR